MVVNTTRREQMKQYLSALTNCRLFSGITEDEIQKILGCMKVSPKHFEKSSSVLREGDILSHTAVILSGTVTLSRPYISEREIFGKASVGEFIGLNNAFLPDKLNFSATAEDEVDILFLDSKQLLEPCERRCDCHLKMIKNLTLILAENSKRASEREQHLARRSTREKLLSYLISASSESNSREFDIIPDRKELAEYLAVDRSAMSSELSKMRNAGLIDFNKNHFTVFCQGNR